MKLFVVLTIFDVVTTLVPEASQQGVLRAFKSYSDVTIFHYNVPNEVQRATWQFAAFMDGKNCASKRVYVYLRWGSYPVITRNSSFPPGMHNSANNSIVATTLTTWATESVLIVPVDTPQPGDWYIAVFLDDTDQEVQQFGYKCRYYMGSVGIWLPANVISSVPVGRTTSVVTSAPRTYFKFFIPAGTWSFRVDLWGCRSLIKQNPGCIKALTLQGRTLPTVEVQSSSLINDSHSFEENSPFEDSYYYLLVVSDSIVAVNVNISLSECLVKIADSKFSPSSRQENSTCLRRFQLIRVQEVEAFASVYLLQGRDGLTPWTLLADENPVVLQFDILPIVDVGGSLVVGAHVDPLNLSINSKIIVNICLRRGRVPDRIIGNRVVCQDNMTVKLAAANAHRGNLLIPYPQPDTWHVILQAQCIACNITEILVSLNIRTQRCVTSGPKACGENGVCEEISQGFVRYSSCRCFNGFHGWGCTDSTGVNLPKQLSASLFLIVSNFFFLPAIFLAIKRKLLAEALVYFSTMFFSSFYHACDEKYVNYCIVKYDVLQYCDFFASILAFWVTLVAMAQLPLEFIATCHIFGVFIISFAVVFDKTALASVLVPLSLGIVISLGFNFYRRYITGFWQWPSRGFFKLIVGIFFATLGILLFATIETETNYYYVHSIWHIMIAISLVFLLPLGPQFSATRQGQVQPIRCI